MPIDEHEEDDRRLERQLAVERESRERNGLNALATSVEKLLTVSNAALARIERLDAGPPQSQITLANNAHVVLGVTDDDPGNCADA
jgi:hypothetical protein